MVAGSIVDTPDESFVVEKERKFSSVFMLVVAENLSNLLPRRILGIAFEELLL